MKGTTTPKRERFVFEYLNNMNATRAAERAGYKHPNVQGSQLLAIPEISTRIRSEIDGRNERLKISSDWVVQRLEMEALDQNNAASVRVRALELLGRHIGFFHSETNEQSDKDAFIFVNV